VCELGGQGKNVDTGNKPNLSKPKISVLKFGCLRAYIDKPCRLLALKNAFVVTATLFSFSILWHFGTILSLLLTQQVGVVPEVPVTEQHFWDTTAWDDAASLWEEYINHRFEDSEIMKNIRGKSVYETVCNSEFAGDLISGMTPEEFKVPWAWSCPSCRSKAPVAFILHVFDGNTLHGAERLLHWLYREDHIFVFHIDEKATDAIHCYMKRRYGAYSNIALSPRHNVTWGSWTIVQAELDAMEVARQLSDKWQFAINLCGQSAAIKSQEYLDAFLDSYLTVRSASTDEGVRLSMIPTNLMEGTNLWAPERERNNLWYRSPLVECEERADDGSCAKVSGTPDGKPWYKGMQWKILSREFVDHVFDSEEGRAWVDFFIMWFLHNSAADESWAQSIARNSPLLRDRTIFNAASMATKWGRCARPSPRDGLSPCYLTEQEYVEDLRHSPFLFARKFVPNDPAIDLIRDDVVLFNRTPGEWRAAFTGLMPLHSDEGL